MDGFAHKQFGYMELSLYKHTCVSHVHVYIVCLVCHYDRYSKQLKEHKIHWDLIVQKLKVCGRLNSLFLGLGYGRTPSQKSMLEQVCLLPGSEEAE